MAFVTDRSLGDRSRNENRLFVSLEAVVGYCAFCSSLAFVLIAVVTL